MTENLHERENERPEELGPEEEYVAADAEDGDDRVIGVAFRRSLLVLVTILVVVGGGGYLLLGRSEGAAPEQAIETAAPEAVVTVAEAPVVPFVDVTAEAGIDFVHSNGSYGDRLLPETMGGGVAFLDYDGDGHEDLLFVNSSQWPHHRYAERAPTMAADVFLTAVGPNRLYRNDGGRFTDVTRAAGVAGAAEEWSTAAGFFDYDADGDLDVVLTQIAGPPLLLRNDQTTGHHWLRVRLEGRPPNRDAIGAWVELSAGGVTQRGGHRGSWRSKPQPPTPDQALCPGSYAKVPGSRPSEDHP